MNVGLSLPITGADCGSLELSLFRAGALCDLKLTPEANYRVSLVQVGGG
jgi:hypothetical protein